VFVLEDSLHLIKAYLYICEVYKYLWNWNCEKYFLSKFNQYWPFKSRLLLYVDCVWNVMAHAQKPDFVFRRKGRVHLNRRGCQFSRLLAAEVCASAVVMLDTSCSEVVWRVLATHSIRQFLLHFSSRASPCAIRFQLDSTTRITFINSTFHPLSALICCFMDLRPTTDCFPTQHWLIFITEAVCLLRGTYWLVKYKGPHTL